MGGIWMPDVTCDPNPCPNSIVVCCFDDGSCDLINFEICEEIGGIVLWDEVRCIPNPCPPKVGLRMAILWDAIKASAAQNGVPVACSTP